MRRKSKYERIMVSVLVSLAIVAGFLIARGYIYGTTEIVRDVSIDAEPGEVWCYIVEPDARVLWEPGLTDVVSLEAPDVATVTRWLLIMRSEGKSYEVEEDIIESRPYRVLRTQRIGDRYQSDVLIALSPDKNAAHLEYSEKIVFEKLFDRIFAPFIGLSWSNKEKVGLARLGELVAKAKDADFKC